MTGTTQDLRWDIIKRWKQCKNIAAAARAARTSWIVAKRWVNRYVDTGDVKDKAGKGRKSAMSPQAVKLALKRLESRPAPTGNQIAQELLSRGLTSTRLHRTSVHRAAKKLAQAQGSPIHAVRGKPGKQVTPATKLKRLCFAKANQSRNWGTVMFTDRKQFLFTYPGFKISPVTWVRKGMRREAPAVNHPMALNVYAGITKYGVTACHVVAGTSKQISRFKNKKGSAAHNITSQEYMAVMKDTLLPQGAQLFKNHRISRWVFQQDNDPAHKDAPGVLERWNRGGECCVAILDNWPPNSPDLNLIENVWAYVQARVEAKGCNNFDSFSKAVLNEFKALPMSMLDNLYKSMPSRIAKVIESGGDKTGY